MRVVPEEKNYNKYVFATVFIMSLYMCVNYYSLKANLSVAGGVGLPVFPNGGDWEESRHVIAYPDDTVFTRFGEPKFPMDRSDNDVLLGRLLTTVIDSVKIITWTIVVVVVAIGFKVLNMGYN